MGQFATPTELAVDILSYARHLLGPNTPIRFLDPAFGTGSFYSALLDVFGCDQIASATALIDPHYGLPATQLWKDQPLSLRIEDFTAATPESNHSLVVCNPPYIRHHHIADSDKQRLKHGAQHASGMKLSGLAGMCCYFLGLTHPWMAPGALAAWLIPSEFMDVNYGKAVKQYLMERVDLLHIHRFDPTDAQFGDAIVSSCVVWFYNRPPSENPVTMSYGGSLHQPRLSVHLSKEQLSQFKKWTQATVPGSTNLSETAISTVGDWFRIRRGIATGDNSFFMLTEEEIRRRDLPMEFMRPILPAPRNLQSNEIAADDAGLPVLPERTFLLDCNLPEAELQARHLSLWEYLQEGRSRGVHLKYLTSRRKPWYSQEKRPPAPIICTYMGRPTAKRSTPFRFIRNHSTATALNVYLLFEPKPSLLRELRDQPDLLDIVWQHLSERTSQDLLRHGRTYGGGLHKLEPNELACVEIGELTGQVVAEKVPGQLLPPVPTK